MCEPCESSLFSLYLNVNAEAFPCSFLEGETNWETGIDIAKCKNFIYDVWNEKRIVEFRENLIKTANNNELNCRECPRYKV